MKAQHVQEIQEGFATPLSNRDGQLDKALSHKYTKRVPTGNPKHPWRYVYSLHNEIIRSNDNQSEVTTEKVYALLDEIAKQSPNSAWRGMTAPEYDATIGAGKGVKSRGDYSASIEGTQFSEHPGDAESYVNSGRDDPRKTGKPTYMVEVNRSLLKPKKDGYWETEPKGAIPQESVLSVHKFSAQDGAIVAARVYPKEKK
jgi:hypothetical protein